MNSCHQELTTRFPTRRSDAEKQAFRQWAIDKAGACGWSARTEETSRAKQKNVVIGNPDHAAILFTAHYDTATNLLLPNLILPRNLPVWICWQLLIVLLVLGASALILTLAGLFIHDAKALTCIFVLIYVGLLAFLSYGPSNRHNANGSSGLAAALDLMAALPEEDRSKCAFILFDSGEKGHTGSKCYAKDHLELAYMRLFVDLDHVGVGKEMLIVSTDMARRCTGYNLLEKTLAETPGCTARFYGSRLTFCGADRKSFKCAVNVLACENRPGLGYIVGRLRTERDTRCDPENLDWLVRGFSSYLSKLVKG